MATKDSPAQLVAMAKLRQRQRDRGVTEYVVQCDDNCGAVFTGPHAARRAAGWATCWRQVAGVETQTDLCPACRNRSGKMPHGTSV